MKSYLTKDLRNVGMSPRRHREDATRCRRCFTRGMTPRWGKVWRTGSTTTDWDEEEIARKISIKPVSTPSGPLHRLPPLALLKSQINLNRYSRLFHFITERSVADRPRMPRSSPWTRTSALRSPPKSMGLLHGVRHSPRFVLTWMDRASSFERSMNRWSRFSAQRRALQLPIGAERGSEGSSIWWP